MGLGNAVVMWGYLKTIRDEVIAAVEDYTWIDKINKEKNKGLHSVLSKKFSNVTYDADKCLYPGGLSNRNKRRFGMDKVKPIPGLQMSSYNALDGGDLVMWTREDDIQCSYCDFSTYNKIIPTNRTPFFSGSILTATCPKATTIDTDILLISKQFNTARIKKPSIMKGQNKIKAESIRFNDNFNSYAVHRSQDFFYIITPQVQEILNNFYEKYHSEFSIYITKSGFIQMFLSGFNAINLPKRAMNANEVFANNMYEPYAYPKRSQKDEYKVLKKFSISKKEKNVFIQRALADIKYLTDTLFPIISDNINGKTTKKNKNITKKDMTIKPSNIISISRVHKGVINYSLAYAKLTKGVLIGTPIFVVVAPILIVLIFMQWGNAQMDKNRDIVQNDYVLIERAINNKYHAQYKVTEVNKHPHPTEPPTADYDIKFVTEHNGIANGKVNAYNSASSDIQQVSLEDDYQLQDALAIQSPIIYQNIPNPDTSKLVSGQSLYLIQDKCNTIDEYLSKLKEKAEQDTDNHKYLPLITVMVYHSITDKNLHKNYAIQDALYFYSLFPESKFTVESYFKDNYYEFGGRGGYNETNSQTFYGGKNNVDQAARLRKELETPSIK